MSPSFNQVLYGWTWILRSACRNHGRANVAVTCFKLIASACRWFVAFHCPFPISGYGMGWGPMPGRYILLRDSKEIHSMTHLWFLNVVLVPGLMLQSRSMDVSTWGTWLLRPAGRLWCLVFLSFCSTFISRFWCRKMIFLTSSLKPSNRFIAISPSGPQTPMQLGDFASPLEKTRRKWAYHATDSSAFVAGLKEHGKAQDMSGDSSNSSKNWLGQRRISSTLRALLSQDQFHSITVRITSYYIPESLNRAMERMRARKGKGIGQREDRHTHTHTQDQKAQNEQYWSKSIKIPQDRVTTPKSDSKKKTLRQVVVYLQ